MITDSEALRAAWTLQGYCIERDGKYRECIFNKAEICHGFTVPEDWKLPDGIPVAVKEHLMRRFTTII